MILEPTDNVSHLDTKKNRDRDFRNNLQWKERPGASDLVVLGRQTLLL